MMQAPYMTSMLESMSANPDFTNQILQANPMFAGNPALQEQLRAQMPHFLQQMQNPEIQSALSNPRALEAMMQIQQGMATLQTEAPGLLPGSLPPAGAPPPAGGAPPTGGTAPPPVGGDPLA